jgi:radical SAM superfamily enzyme YgiQ (UPF0313 family)
MLSRRLPPGLASIAGCLLRAGHEVRVVVREEQLVKHHFDWPRADAELKDMLRDFRPEIVGLSVMTPMMPESATVARWAKEICGTQTFVVAGGVHPSALPELTLRQCPAVDAVVVGEGEQTILEVAERGLEATIAGLVLRAEEGFLHGPARCPLLDLDSLPRIPYELFDMDFYTRPSRCQIRWLKLSAANLRTSRGCTNRCEFCAGHIVAGEGIRLHSIDRVIEEMLHAADRLGVEAIHFEDDTIGADRARLLTLCEAMRRKGLHRRLAWDCCLRVDQVDSELLAELKSAGCIQVEYGFESGSDDSLRRLGKGTSVDSNRQAVELTRRAHLRIYANIMVGLPGETEEDFDATVRFLRWARPEIINFARLWPMPGTPIYNRLSAEVRDSLDWGQYAYFDRAEGGVNLTAMPEEVFRHKFRQVLRYLVVPQYCRAVLRDSAKDEVKLRRALRRKLAGFILRHPVRAARVPW